TLFPYTTLFRSPRAWGIPFHHYGHLAAAHRIPQRRRPARPGERRVTYQRCVAPQESRPGDLVVSKQDVARGVHPIPLPHLDTILELEARGNLVRVPSWKKGDPRRIPEPADLSVNLDPGIQ